MKNIPPLNGLRGVAVLMVIIYHTNLIGPKPILPAAINFLLTLPEGLWSGVDLFFVLSGFLITGVLCQHRDQPHFFRNFYMRRILRLAPVYYFVIVMAQWISVQFHVEHLLPNLPLYLLLYYLNFANVSVFLSDQLNIVMQVAWTLAIEEQFYAGWSAVVYKLQDRQLMRVAIFLILLSPFIRVAGHLWWGWSPIRVVVFTPGRLDGLAWGALIYLLWQGNNRSPVLQRIGIGGPLIALATLAAVNLYCHSLDCLVPGVQMIGISAFALLYASILCLILCGNWLPLPITILNTRFLQLMGKHSYAIYLVHQPVREYVSSWFPFAYLKQFPWHSAFIQISLTVTVTIISFILSWIIWHLFEKRFLALKDKFP